MYSYRTVGREETDAAGGVSHTYPDTTTVTVTTSPCGFTLRWDGLEQRWDSWTLCAAGRQLYVTKEVFKHSFYGVSDQHTYNCDHAFLRPGGEAAGTPVTGHCTGSTDNATWSGRVVGVEQAQVAGATVPALHVHAVEHLTGKTDGDRTWDDWWALDSDLLLRRHWSVVGDSATVFGGAHYTESVTLDLISSTPAR